MAIEALLFDLGKVLVDFDFELGLERFSARSALSRAEFEQVIRDPAWIHRYETGAITTEVYHRYLRESGRLEMSLEEFHEAWSSVFLPDPILPERLLASLKESYPLILVSNTNEAHANFVERRYSLFHHFDHLIFSHEVGAMKPDQRIYDAAIAAAGKSPESLFFTDDREENVESALRLGIRAHRFDSVSGLVEALRSHGVRVGDFVPS